VVVSRNRWHMSPRFAAPKLVLVYTESPSLVRFAVVYIHCYRCRWDVASASRQNNFVTQNCIKCAKTSENAKTISLGELPEIYCLKCSRTLRAEYVGLYRDYGYKCGCGWQVLLGAKLPYWEDAGFEYSGVAAPGDQSYPVS
jgi:hypothetical protein